MKKYLLSVFLFCFSTLAWCEAVKQTFESSTVGTVTLSSPDAGGWKFSAQTQVKDGKEYIHLHLTNIQAATPPTFQVSFQLPQQDIHQVWTSNDGKYNKISADWGSNYDSQLASQMPLYACINESNTNRLTIACNESLRYISAKVALREEGCLMIGQINYFLQPEAPMKEYDTDILLDNRSCFWAESVREAADWMFRSANMEPCPVPEGATQPLYSSWYQFHQNLHAQDIEEECKLASDMGMKTIIIDDGWQTDDTNRGYAYCGDWEVSKNRFPDMAAHVKKVHALGMKYMVWYSVPFMGYKSKNYERFKGKYLYLDDGQQAAVLDPRFPEVRSFLIGIYEKAMREWDLDGFKLDFIDNFVIKGTDPAIAENYAGRDIQSVPEAVNVLMKEIRTHLSAIKPDVLLEFRQTYIGPAIRQYGNMFRASDCPGNIRSNRIRIANLRLTSGETAVHADMLEWNLAESPLQAARNIENCLFGVIQYSVMLRQIPESHKAVIKQWLDFSQQHKETLLKGTFKPYYPDLNYPLIEAAGPNERIFGVYEENLVVKVPADKPETYLINAANATNLVTELESPASATIYDAYGKQTATQELKAGITRISVPQAGYICIRNH